LRAPALHFYSGKLLQIHSGVDTFRHLLGHGTGFERRDGFEKPLGKHCIPVFLKRQVKPKEYTPTALTCPRSMVPDAAGRRCVPPH